MFQLSINVVEDGRFYDEDNTHEKYISRVIPIDFSDADKIASENSIEMVEDFHYYSGTYGFLGAPDFLSNEVIESFYNAMIGVIDIDIYDARELVELLWEHIVGETYIGNAIVGFNYGWEKAVKTIFSWEDCAMTKWDNAKFQQTSWVENLREGKSGDDVVAALKEWLSK